MPVATRDRQRALPPVSYPGNATGVLYEPRAFWGVRQCENTGRDEGVPFRTTLSRENFLNSERYPVTITRILTAPIGYIFRQFENGPPTGELTYRAGGSAAFQHAKIRISVPQRKHFSRMMLGFEALAARPTWEPQISGYTGLDYASSMWGFYRWDFDHPMIMPRLGTMEFQFGTIDAPNVPLASDLGRVFFNVAVYEGPPPVDPSKPEAPGALLWPGNARTSAQLARDPVTNTTILDRTLHYNGLANAPGGGQGGNIVVPRDPNYGNGAFAPGALVSPQRFDPRDQFSTPRYDQKNANASGPSPVTGFGIHLDQIDYDDAIETTPVTGNPGGQPISPLGLKTGVRARTTNGGSGAWWFRNDVEGWAPTALVCPTITPANVYILPKPITLEQGDSLEVELEVPGPIVIDDNLIEQTYTIGVSATGFAMISG